MIEAKDLRDNEYIEIYYPYGNGNDYPSNLKTDIYIDKLGKKPLENYFMLNTVRSGIFNNQVAIMDLKFGISNEDDLKIIRPVDIYKGMIWETNIHFINSLMNEISKMIPEELENYFSKYR